MNIKVTDVMDSINRIDALQDKAYLDVHQSIVDIDDKYRIIKEYATSEYAEHEYYQESVLAGVLIGLGVIGLVASTILIIKKINSTEGKGEGAKKTEATPAAEVNILDKKSVDTYKAELTASITKAAAEHKMKPEEVCGFIEFSKILIDESAKHSMEKVSEVAALLDSFIELDPKAEDYATKIKECNEKFNTCMKELTDNANGMVGENNTKITPDWIESQFTLIGNCSENLKEFDEKIKKVDEHLKKREAELKQNSGSSEGESSDPEKEKEIKAETENFNNSLKKATYISIIFKKFREWMNELGVKVHGINAKLKQNKEPAATEANAGEAKSEPTAQPTTSGEPKPAENQNTDNAGNNPSSYNKDDYHIDKEAEFRNIEIFENNKDFFESRGYNNPYEAKEMINNMLSLSPAQLDNVILTQLSQNEYDYVKLCLDIAEKNNFPESQQIKVAKNTLNSKTTTPEPEPKVEPVNPEPKVEPVNPEPKETPVNPEPKVEPVNPEPKETPVNPEPKETPVNPEPKETPVNPEPKVEPETKETPVNPEPKVEPETKETPVNPEPKVEPENTAEKETEEPRDESEEIEDGIISYIDQTFIMASILSIIFNGDETACDETIKELESKISDENNNDLTEEEKVEKKSKFSQAIGIFSANVSSGMASIKSKTPEIKNGIAQNAGKLKYMFNGLKNKIKDSDIVKNVAELVDAIDRVETEAIKNGGNAEGAEERAEQIIQTVHNENNENIELDAAAPNPTSDESVKTNESQQNETEEESVDAAIHAIAEKFSKTKEEKDISALEKTTHDLYDAIVSDKMNVDDVTKKIRESATDPKQQAFYKSIYKLAKNEDINVAVGTAVEFNPDEHTPKVSSEINNADVKATAAKLDNRNKETIDTSNTSLLVPEIPDFDNPDKFIEATKLIVNDIPLLYERCIKENNVEKGFEEFRYERHPSLTFGIKYVQIKPDEFENTSFMNLLNEFKQHADKLSDEAEAAIGTSPIISNELATNARVVIDVLSNLISIYKTIEENYGVLIKSIIEESYNFTALQDDLNGSLNKLKKLTDYRPTDGVYIDKVQAFRALRANSGGAKDSMPSMYDINHFNKTTKKKNPHGQPTKKQVDTINENIKKGNVKQSEEDIDIDTKARAKANQDFEARMTRNPLFAKHNGYIDANDYFEKNKNMYIDAVNMDNKITELERTSNAANENEMESPINDARRSFRSANKDAHPEDTLEESNNRFDSIMKSFENAVNEGRPDDIREIINNPKRTMAEQRALIKMANIAGYDYKGANVVANNDTNDVNTTPSELNPQAAALNPEKQGVLTRAKNKIKSWFNNSYVETIRPDGSMTMVLVEYEFTEYDDGTIEKKKIRVINE